MLAHAVVWEKDQYLKLCEHRISVHSALWFECSGGKRASSQDVFALRHIKEINPPFHQGTPPQLVTSLCNFLIKALTLHQTSSVYVWFIGSSSFTCRAQNFKILNSLTNSVSLCLIENVLQISTNKTPFHMGSKKDTNYKLFIDAKGIPKIVCALIRTRKDFNES